MIKDNQYSVHSEKLYTLKEVVYSDLTDLVCEAIETQGFLPLKADEQPFLHVMPRIFEGHPDFHSFVLLEEQSQQAGFIVVLPHQEEHTLSIGPMYISNRYRGKGLGKRLVQELIGWSQVNGVKRLFTQTWGGNVASKRIFEGLGFEYIGEEAKTRVNGDSTVKYYFHLER
jgi:L-amino acid N-acyltransferase YncA